MLAVVDVNKQRSLILMSQCLYGLLDTDILEVDVESSAIQNLPDMHVELLSTGLTEGHETFQTGSVLRQTANHTLLLTDLQLSLVVLVFFVCVLGETHLRDVERDILSKASLEVLIIYLGLHLLLGREHRILRSWSLLGPGLVGSDVASSGKGSIDSLI